MIGLRGRLALYFVLLGLVPAAAALLGLSALAAHDQTARTNTRLESELRASVGVYVHRVNAAETKAVGLAGNGTLVRLLVRADRPGLRHFLARKPGIVVSSAKVRAGRLPRGLAVVRIANVRAHGRVLGRVMVAVAVNDAQVQALRTRAAVRPGDTLAIVRTGRIAAASPPLAGHIDATPGRATTVDLSGIRYQTLVSASLRDPTHGQLAVLTPSSSSSLLASSNRLRLSLVLLGLLGVVAIGSLLEGRAIVGRVRGLAAAVNEVAHGQLHERVPVRGRDELAQLGRAFNEMASQLEWRIDELDRERDRLAAAIERIGDTFASTLDPGQLLQVMVDTVREATGATGAALTSEHSPAIRSGDTQSGDGRLELPLTAGEARFGTLTLWGATFEDEQVAAAKALTAQAGVALENARLHAIVAREARLDALTGLANRREIEQALVREVARAQRLGTALSIVVADLDDFKAINDRHGHSTGDDVLRAFARVLEHTLREIDLAGRWGGEEFLALLPGTNADGAVRLAERVRAAIAAEPIGGEDGTILRVTSSFGVSTFARGQSREALFARADDALYRAKAAGKNRVERAAGGGPTQESRKR